MTCAMTRLLMSTFLMIFMLLVAGQFLSTMGHDIRSSGAAGGQPRTLVLSGDRPAESSASRDSGLTIDRDDSGQFHVVARVDGQDATFLVDTGADVVALTVDEAERLGIHVQPGDFEQNMQTASGVGNGARVNIDRLELDGEEFSKVHAVVVEGLQENLLGQSVLRRLGNVQLSGDRMIIRSR
jgi:aspartyl protease family protein